MDWVQPAAVTALEQASQSRVRYPHWPIIECNASRCKLLVCAAREPEHQLR